MTPRVRCENDTGYETCLPGLPVPSGSPIFFVGNFVPPEKAPRKAREKKPGKNTGLKTGHYASNNHSVKSAD
jgi:chloramphenicol 3-O-phosphotransferase